MKNYYIAKFLFASLWLFYATAFSQTIHYVNAGENTLYDAIQAATSGDIIELVDDGGVYVYTGDSDKIEVDKVLTIRATVGLTNKPVIRNDRPGGSTSMRNFEIISGGALKLSGLEFDGSLGDGVPVAKQAIRMNVGDSSVTFLKVDDCYFHDYTENFLRGYAKTVIDTFIVENTVSTNALREGWNLYDSGGDGSAINYALFENVTIARTGREAIQFGSAAVGYNPEVIINHCTMDSTALDQNDRVVRFGAGTIDVTNATITNCIMSNQMGTQTRCVTLFGTSTIAYTDTFNVRPVDLNGEESSIGLAMVDVDPEYSDPTTGDYTLSETSPLLGQADDGWALGDVRWDPNYIPVTIHRVEAGENTLYDAVQAAASGDIIELVDNGGVYLYTRESDKLEIDKVLTIRAKEGLNNRPIIRNDRPGGSSSMRNFEVLSGGALTLIGLEFDGSLGDGVPMAKQAIRMNVGDSTTTFLKVYDCYFHNYTENFLRGYSKTVIDTFIIENTISTNALREGWNLYDSGGDGPAINYALFENVTVTRTGREAIQFGSAAVGYNPEVVINHCTLDSTALDQNDRVIRFGGGNIDVTNATITNTIMSNQMGTQTRSVTLYGTSTIAYTDTFNVRPVDLQDTAVLGDSVIDVDPMYNDPASLDYRLATNSPVREKADDGQALGDLRWEADPGNFYLTIETQGSGTVSLDPANGPYAPATSVEMTAVPNPGWAFSMWEGNVFPPNANPVNITMNSDENVKAVFVSLTPQVTVEIDTIGLGYVTADPEAVEGSYDEGTSITLTAVARENWEFVEWLGDVSGTDNPVTFSADSNMNVTASFQSIFTQFELVINVLGQGSVEQSPAPVIATYDTAAVVELTAMPVLGWDFVNWSGDLAGDMNPISVQMDSNITLTATFMETQYTSNSLEIDTSWSLYDAVELANNNSIIDTLVLVTSGGLYTSYNTSDVAVTAPLKIMAKEDLAVKPIITNSDVDAGNLDVFRVFDDFTLQGVVMDGGHEMSHGMKYGIRLRHYTGTDSVKTGTNITVMDCDFVDFFEGKNAASDGHAYKQDVDLVAGDVLFENCTFTNFGYEAIRISDTEKYVNTEKALESLTIRNCTFTNIDAEAIRYYSDVRVETADAPVIIEHVTFNNTATRVIYLKNSSGAIVRDIIIANSRKSGHGRDDDLMEVQGLNSIASHIDTFNVAPVEIQAPKDGIVDSLTIYGFDPQFVDAENLDYTLAEGSPAYGKAHDNEALGDLRWATNVTGLVDAEELIPSKFYMKQNYPNPFNPSTTIAFGLNEASKTKLVVYNVLGREIATLINKQLAAGNYEVQFHNTHLASGIYFYRLVSGKNVSVRKMLFVK